MTDAAEYDVIIIGGGPAGSTVARYAAEGGANVLVIDGRDPIGTPLQCGELVPSNDEMRRLCPDVPDMDDHSKLHNKPSLDILRKCMSSLLRVNLWSTILRAWY